MHHGRDTITLPLLTSRAVIFPGVASRIELSNPQQADLIQRMAQLDQNLALSWNEEMAHDPAGIATTARVVSQASHEAPQHTVTVVGVQRIALLSWRHERGVLRAQCRYLPDIEDQVPIPLVDEAKALGSELWGLLRCVDRHPRLPVGPERLSYWIAAHVPVTPSTQQELLELKSTRTRLAKEITLMRMMLDGYRTEHSRD